MIPNVGLCCPMSVRLDKAIKCKKIILTSLEILKFLSDNLMSSMEHQRGFSVRRHQIRVEIGTGVGLNELIYVVLYSFNDFITEFIDIL